ncbi:hypothetical protein RA955_09520 [Geobacillus proteiniphilus]|uniref:Uncharacterized protein n=1 Tax=Geobacillus proteiniphilus TaxID=860353 RepID=A0ABY9MAR7_9BACL|nr:MULTISPECIES: hypothetical protein [Geobacillus]WMJ15106.1 hypothetical protein RA955_09520 [Geobacillus proteiniphilus]
MTVFEALMFFRKSHGFNTVAQSKEISTLKLTRRLGGLFPSARADPLYGNRLLRGRRCGNTFGFTCYFVISNREDRHFPA